MNGIIFNTEQDFNNWNQQITTAMVESSQLMDNWCTPIISRDGSNLYLGITECDGIRRRIIEQFFDNMTEVDIELNDSVWFEQHTLSIDEPLNI